MTIGALIAVQLVFDVLLVLLLVAVARQRREAAAPPAWHDEFLQLAKEVMAVADSLLEVPERREAAAAETPATPRREPAATRRPASARDEAFSLLRAGMEPDAVRRRTGVLPGELRLITSLVASERKLHAQGQGLAAPTRQGLPASGIPQRPLDWQPTDFPDERLPAPSGTPLA